MTLPITTDQFNPKLQPPLLHRRLRCPNHHGQRRGRPCSASGERSAARRSRRITPDNLIVQLGLATEPLNRHWYEKTTGQVIKDVQSWIRHPVIRWMAATLDGVVEGTGAVFEAKFMLPWSFSEEAAAEKHMPQLQHNMWVTNATGAVLSIITGGGKWVEIKISADPLYQHLLSDGGKEILALRGERRAPSPLRCRAAARPHRGGADRRHELVQCLGGILRRLSPHPRGLSRA